MGALKEIDTTAIRPVAMTLATSGSKILISGYTIDPNGHDHYAFSSFSQSPLRMMEEEDNTNKPSLTCYPSPAFDFIHIKTDADMQNAQLTITNMNGSVVMHQPMEDGENTIPVGDLPNGIYALMLSDEAHNLTKKFMVQH